jgi:hypothetical protein
MKLSQKCAKMLILMVACVGLTAAVAGAQVVSKGAFTLPHAVQWGKHMLPKGDYQYTIRKTGMKGVTVTAIKAAGSPQQLQMVGLQRTPDASIKGADTSVVLSHDTTGSSLRGIYLAESNVEYVFPNNTSRWTVVAENPKPGQEVTPRLVIRKITN